VSSIRSKYATNILFIQGFIGPSVPRMFGMTKVLFLRVGQARGYSPNPRMIIQGMTVTVTGVAWSMLPLASWPRAENAC
jgi:hypothetical protein